ncbi:eight transmembrane protein EpsH [Sphingobium chlorophenolicum L-1]|uniref:Eight transmembrane protein EpsH n=1 Tax=Sphingobium chlorophenolicum L-1 TaxID=690566 RepID=F6EW40_SPHCR|nr:EpsI domain-containing exosortase [Sphingobium chlorophenolicum]AEG48919.1 eight transmembrane protein EpsH [Sphingobium chlorophenolicum L-1]
MIERILSMKPEGELVGWRGHLTALGIIAFTILALFHRDALGMMAIWWNASTYGHCLFVPIIIAWLVQQRLPGLRKLEPTAWMPGLLWLVLGAFAWMLGAAAGVAVVRHGALILMLQGSVIALLGPAVTRALLFPLFYAFFMVPFGEEIVAPLQLVTAHISMALLHLTGIPAQMQGIFITTPGGYFEVAEACSGAKFVIAMTAYGVLVCNVCFTRWKRRIAFMTGALSLSILANGVRAFATIFVAEMTTINAAAGFDHVVYGWLFFAVIMIVVMATAWPFFDRKPGDPWFDPDRLRQRGGSATGAMAGGALAIIVAAPLWLAASTAAGPALPAAPAMPDVKGWVRSDENPLHPWRPRFDGADYLSMARYRNAAGQVVDLAVATFDRQDEGRELVGFAQGAADPDGDWTWAQPAPAPSEGRGEQITGPGRVVRHVVSFYIVGTGRPTGSGHLVKLETMKARLLRGDQRAAAILVSAEEGEGRSSDAAIGAFLRDLGDVKDLADRSLGTR